jgi:hypothetical protein
VNLSRSPAFKKFGTAAKRNFTQATVFEENQARILLHGVTMGLKQVAIWAPLVQNSLAFTRN